MKLYIEGESIVNAARIVGVKTSTAQSIIQRYRKYSGQKIMKRHGKLTAPVLAEIERLIRETPGIPLTHVAGEIAESMNVALSTCSIYNALKKRSSQIQHAARADRSSTSAGNNG